MVKNSLHNGTVSHLADSGVHSQQSLNRSVKIEILQPEVKELLTNCASYNLENVKKVGGASDSRSAEVLEEIRHAEAIETIQRSKDSTTVSRKILFRTFGRFSYLSKLRKKSSN